MRALDQPGDATRVGLDYKELPRDVRSGDVLLLDDGRLVLDVKHVSGAEIHTVTRHGGWLSNNKGINRQGGGLTAPALTPKDIDDIRTAASIKATSSRSRSRRAAPTCTWRASCCARPAASRC
jgi:pyruvate kinase